MRIDRGDIPPGAEAAVRRFQNSLANVGTKAAHLERLAREPIEPFAGMDEGRLNQLARGSRASRELVDTAAAVARGECTWREIVEGNRRQPPEIATLIVEGIPFAFATPKLASPDAPLPGRPPEVDIRPTNRSPYDDEDEDYPPRSWLV
ncbi:hypothetical protein [Nocardia sp. X0981]